MAIAPGPDSLPTPSAVLIVLDGWGLAPDGPGNAVSLADTPVFDELWAGYPHTELTACGRAVGLPEGQMGNSEVGHLNLGAGAVVVAGPDPHRRGSARPASWRPTTSCAGPLPTPSGST